VAAERLGKQGHVFVGDYFHLKNDTIACFHGCCWLF